jgi:hypothetical protein
MSRALERAPVTKTDRNKHLQQYGLHDFVVCQFFSIWLALTVRYSTFSGSSTTLIRTEQWGTIASTSLTAVFGGATCGFLSKHIFKTPAWHLNLTRSRFNSLRYQITLIQAYQHG